MVTIAQIITAFDTKAPFKDPYVDHGFIAVSLLRERIPYEACHSIISGGAHDIVYLCNVDVACEYLSEEDLDVLADCNMSYDEDFGTFFLFV